MICNEFLKINEYCAAGLYEEEGRSLFYRKSLGIRRFYENCKLSEYNGEYLYPSGLLPIEMNIYPRFASGISIKNNADEKVDKNLLDTFRNDFLKFQSSVPYHHKNGGDVFTHSMPNYERILKERQTNTIFFGGGTPSILEGDAIVRIMEKLKELGNISETAEISIEANPGTVTEEKLRLWKQAGINRISFGLQSADNSELKQLGRIHTWEEFEANYHLARTCGFKNINVDLMSALPGQTVDTWRETMEKVTALEPEHVSAYSLIIEEGTPFYEVYDKHPELLPTEEEERAMY